MSANKINFSQSIFIVNAVEWPTVIAIASLPLHFCPVPLNRSSVSVCVYRFAPNNTNHLANKTANQYNINHSTLILVDIYSLFS